jgi:GNAT superfamily N-acetyltransferase
MISVQQISLPFQGFALVHSEARAEGYDFVNSLEQEWSSGQNRFEGPGEALWGCVDNGLLVAVGGLNQDPFAGDPSLGRIRRVYVRPAWRNRGIGGAMVAALIEKARTGFRAVRLHAENKDAARLYEKLGFIPVDHPYATHVLLFGDAGGGSERR